MLKKENFKHSISDDMISEWIQIKEARIIERIKQNE